MVVKFDYISARIVAEACRGAEWVEDCTFCSIATGWGSLLGSGGPVLALTHACKMVRSPTLFAGCAISRAVSSSYPGRGAPAMAALVAVIARVVAVSCFTPFDVILFGTTVLAACGIYTLALRQAASGLASINWKTSSRVMSWFLSPSRSSCISLSARPRVKTSRKTFSV